VPTPYNGHHCWNCWNVSLWIGNDEGLYLLALECKAGPMHILQGPVSPAGAVRRFKLRVGNARTPDGASYTFKAVQNALEGLE